MTKDLNYLSIIHRYKVRPTVPLFALLLYYLHIFVSK